MTITHTHTYTHTHTARACAHERTHTDTHTEATGTTHKTFSVYSRVQFKRFFFFLVERELIYPCQQCRTVGYDHHTHAHIHTPPARAHTNAHTHTHTHTHTLRPQGQHIKHFQYILGYNLRDFFFFSRKGTDIPMSTMQLSLIHI